MGILNGQVQTHIIMNRMMLARDILTDSDLSFRLCCQFCKEISLAFGHVVLTLLKSLFGLVPSLLGDLLFSFLSVLRISTDGGMSLLVKGLNLKLKSMC